jgi:hypothetical protein
MYLVQRCREKNEQIGMGMREGHCGLTLSGLSFLLASAAIFFLIPSTIVRFFYFEYCDNV